MKVEDLRSTGAGWQIRLHEKDGKQHAMPCHHALAEALHAYIAAAGVTEDRRGFLFRTPPGHTSAVLSEQPMTQPDADGWCAFSRRHSGADALTTEVAALAAELLRGAMWRSSFSAAGQVDPWKGSTR